MNIYFYLLGGLIEFSMSDAGTDWKVVPTFLDEAPLNPILSIYGYYIDLCVKTDHNKIIIEKTKLLKLYKESKLLQANAVISFQ